MKINTNAQRLVVITGAGSGIGRATAVRFARKGAHVIVSDRDLDTAEATVAIVRAGGNSASAYQLDVTDPAAWKTFARDVHADHGVPDVLVNNAGIMVSGPFVELEPSDWHRQLEVNLMGAVYGCRTFGTLMIDNGHRGHIVNIASAAALTPTLMFPAYSVSKAALKMLSECLRLELGPNGVGVSAVCPGFINTNIGKNATYVGIEKDVVESSLQLGEQIQEFMARLPYSPMSPDLVARAVVRAVRFDLAVVPVRPEAWLSYFMQRIAPGVNRNLTRSFAPERMGAVDARALGRLVSLFGKAAPTSNTKSVTVDSVMVGKAVE